MNLKCQLHRLKSVTGSSFKRMDTDYENNYTDIYERLLRELFKSKLTLKGALIFKYWLIF